jgi:hypothetical protein
LCQHAAQAHSAWPDLHSARTEIGCAVVDAAASGGSLEVERPEVCALQIRVTLEVPMAAAVVRFQEEFRDLDLAAEIRAGRIEQLEERFRARQFEELSTGLAVRVDGIELGEVTWQETERFGNGYGFDGFFVYELEMQLPRPFEVRRRTSLVVRHGNFPRRSVMYAHLVDPAAPLRVLESSVPLPPPDADLEPGSAAELALWSGDSSRSVYEVVVEPVWLTPGPEAGDGSPDQGED